MKHNKSLALFFGPFLDLPDPDRILDFDGDPILLVDGHLL